LRLPKLLAIATASVLAAGGLGALAHSELEGSSGPMALSSSAHGAALTGSSGTVRTTAPRTAAPRGGGLSVPAAGVPLSSGFDPANPSAGASPGTPGKLPMPTAATLPTVAPLTAVRQPDAVVLLSASATPAQLAQLAKLKGVQALEVVDTGTVQLGGAPVVAFGVNPGSFRAFTPPASAASDELWRYVAGGALVSSYEMSSDRGLKLGSVAQIVPASATSAGASVQGWLGAFASIGLPGVDLLVSKAFSSQLALTPSSGVIVSAPSISGPELEGELQGALPGAAVELLRASQVPQTIPGNTIDSSTRQKIISAALSRIGMPYVWGGNGPNQFDCSGLVQWAFRQAGILMPRVADEQFLTGDHVPLADAQPGDLLFWTYDPNDPGYVDHVAIYLGNGLMVVAPHTGLNVEVESVPTANFAGAVEVVLRSS
jgi:cell wall-associated NlpC family hydrolase